MPAISDRALLLTIGAAVVAAIVATGAWIAVSAPAAELPALDGPSPGAIAGLASEAAAPASDVVVDVEGAVITPGLHRLPAGSRLADAIEAAGGYASDVDLDAASRQLNLAAPLTDGQQVRVPRLGEAAAPAASGDPGTAGGGLVNLNTASPDELDALPGIGPVTVQKIVAARQEAPFVSLDDAVAREVMNAGQLEKIRDLATV